MKNQEATKNIKLTGYLLVSIGIFGFIGSIIYWDSNIIIKSTLKILFSLAYFYFGYLLLISIKSFTNRR